MKKSTQNLDISVRTIIFAPIRDKDMFKTFPFMRKLFFLTMMAVAVSMQAQEKMHLRGVCPMTMDSVLVIDLAHGYLYARIPAKQGTFATSLPIEKDAVMGIGSRDYYIPFFADGDTLDVDLVKHAVKGSHLNEMTFRCDQSLDSLDQSLKGRMETLKALAKEGDEPFARQQMKDLMESRIARRIDILKPYANTMVPAAFLPDMFMEMSYEQVKPWLMDKAPYWQHPRMSVPKQYAEGLKKKQPGRKFVNLAMRDFDGTIRHLDEWCGKGNYVLVDFWASWCGPCRKEMPNVVENYVKYHGKGFEIVGVSFDQKEEQWKAAVKQMGMDWVQISDLKGWESAASEAYGVMAIPSNVLLDGEGRIVAYDLRGEKLGEKLKELYGF